MKVPRRVEAAVAPMLVAVGMATAPHAAAAGNVFRHDLSRVDGHLRIAIEYAPAELGESLRTAEIVCALGERAASRQEDSIAAADWTTLDQVVGEAAEGGAHRVGTAFDAADSLLRAVRDRFDRRWTAATARGRELRRGIGETRSGIAVLRAAIARLTTPFAAWRGHECATATRGAEAAFSRGPAGLRKINVGMLRLWRIAGLAPSPSEGK